MEISEERLSYLQGLSLAGLLVSERITTRHEHKKCEKYDDVIKWKHFPRNWPFVRGIHRSPVNSPHKGQWRGALMFTLICVWINDWVNNREAGDLRRYRAHCDVIVMIWQQHARITPYHTECITVTTHGHHGVSNYQQIDCLFNSLLKLASKKTSKPRITCHRWSMDSPSQKASNAEDVSIMYLKMMLIKHVYRHQLYKYKYATSSLKTLLKCCHIVMFIVLNSHDETSLKI